MQALMREARSSSLSSRWDAALWGDDVRLSDLEPKFTCKACGRRGAEVRPLFEKSGMGTG
jgi:hypothetical protein